MIDSSDKLENESSLPKEVSDSENAVEENVEDKLHLIETIEAEIQDAIEQLGPDDPAVADLHEKLARLLRKNGIQTLKAANAEARAKVIRDKYKETDGKVVDTQKCPHCAETIKIDAKICRYCRLSVNQPYSEPIQQVVINQKSGPSPGVAAFLSFLLPGAGSIYAGAGTEGIILFCVWCFQLVLMFVFIGFITAPIVWVLSIAHAAHVAEKKKSFLGL